MKYQFMPLFWGDFLANTMHLTAQEAGAYLFLIAHAWEHEGQIAVVDLQRIARVSNFNWRKVRPRLEQFFDTLSVSNFWISERVQSELTHASEISNKRKAAAQQMHSKASANGHAKHPPSTLQLPIENLANGKGRETPPVPQAVFQDKSEDYRSPPKTKIDNPLVPIPDRPPAERPIRRPNNGTP